MGNNINYICFWSTSSFIINRKSVYIAVYWGSLPTPKEPEEKIEPEEPKFEDVDQETLDKEFADEEVNLAFLNDEKSLNTSDEDPNNKKENTQMQKEEIGLYKNVGVTKIKGKLGFPKAQHNKEQIKKALKSQGVDIKFLDEE